MILIIGGDGLLGSALLTYGRGLGWSVQATTRRPLAVQSGMVPLDLAAPPNDWTIPTNCESAVLCAGITRLDACRLDRDRTRQINVGQTIQLARRLTDTGVFVTFLSTNLVFDGSRPRQGPTDTLSPRTEYGRQKAEVEAALAAMADQVAIVRLTKVVHDEWPLLRGWTKELQAGRCVRPFNDLVCAPVPLDLVTRGVSDIAINRRPGIWQFSAPMDVNYADIAFHLADRIGADRTRVRPARTGQGAGSPLEHLPRHTTLDTSRARVELGLQFPEALDAVDRAFRLEAVPSPSGRKDA